MVTAGGEASVQAGTLVVFGTGDEAYNVFDASGQERLVAFRPTNQAAELLPGTYTVEVGDQSFDVEVRPDQQTEVDP